MMTMMMRRTTLQIPQAVLLLLLLATMIKADLRGVSSSSSRAIGHRSVDEVPSVVSYDAHSQERFLAAKPGLSTNDVLDGPGDHGKKPSKKGKKSKTSSEGTPPSENSDVESTTTEKDESESGGEITTRQSSSGGLGGNVGRAPVTTGKFEFVLVCIHTWHGGDDPALNYYNAGRSSLV
jgi:hypothetical protein